MSVVVIPARSGSKRIKNKNIKIFNGKPIIYYSINAAKKTKLFKRIIVSTDSKKIQKLAKKFGAECSFLRPKNLSGDKIGTAPVIEYAIKKFNIKSKFVCCIYPAAPLIRYNDIISSYKKIKNKKCLSCYTITKYDFPIQRALTRDKNNQVKFLNYNSTNKRSQDLEARYHDAAQFYWLNTKLFLKKKSLYSNKSIGYLIPSLRAQDIDDNNDWNIALAKFNKMNK